MSASTLPALASAVQPLRPSLSTHLATGERFVRWTTVHRIYCWPRELGGHKVERGVFICGHAGLQCSFTIKTDNRGDLPRNARPTLSGCDRRLYVVHNPASDQVLTVAATYEEIIRIQRERMSEFEALHYLGVIVPPGVRA